MPELASMGPKGIRPDMDAMIALIGAHAGWQKSQNVREGLDWQATLGNGENSHLLYPSKKPIEQPKTQAERRSPKPRYRARQAFGRCYSPELWPFCTAKARLHALSTGQQLCGRCRRDALIAQLKMPELRYHCDT